MPNKRPAIKRANALVGLFVLLTVVLLLVALFLGPRTRRWLTPTQAIKVRLPPEGSLGLRKGADVLILGTVIGTVDDIAVSDAGEMEAEVSVRGDFVRFVRRDSKAIVRKPFGIGDASIEITRGAGEPLPVVGARIQSSADKNPAQVMDETLEAIRTEALPALRDLRGAVAEYGKLATDLRGQQPALASALNHVNQIGSSVQEGKGILGMIVTDPEPAKELRGTLPKINASLDDLRIAVADLRKATAALPELERAAKQSIDATPALILQIQETSRQLQRLVEAVQRNWLVRGTMDQPNSNTRINPDRVGAGR